MAYAIRKDGQGARAVDSPADITSDEEFLDASTPPAPFHRLVAGKPQLALDAFKGSLLPALRATRDTALNVLDGLQSDALTVGDSATALAIKTAKQACRDLPSLDTSAATDEASLRTLFANEWRRITAMLPVSLRASFQAAIA